MPEEQDEICRATVDPLPADHESLKHRRYPVPRIKEIDWKGGVWLTVPRKGCLGVDRYIIRCGVVVEGDVPAPGDCVPIVCPDPESGPPVPLSDAEAKRILLQHEAELRPYLETWGIA